MRTYQWWILLAAVSFWIGVFSWLFGLWVAGVYAAAFIVYMAHENIPNFPNPILWALTRHRGAPCTS